MVSPRNKVSNETCRYVPSPSACSLPGNKFTIGLANFHATDTRICQRILWNMPRGLYANVLVLPLSLLCCKDRARKVGYRFSIENCCPSNPLSPVIAVSWRENTSRYACPSGSSWNSGKKWMIPYRSSRTDTEVGHR